MSPCERPPGSKKYIFRVLLKLKFFLNLVYSVWRLGSNYNSFNQSMCTNPCYREIIDLNKK